MDRDINNRFGNDRVFTNLLEKGLMSMEKICSMICLLVGTVFLVMALFGAWRYFFTMGLCYAVAVMVYDDNKEHKDRQ